MAFFDKFKRWFSTPEPKAAPGSSASSPVYSDLTTDVDTPKVVKVVSPLNAYRTRFLSAIEGSRTGFDAYDYNLTEIAQCEDTESFLMAAFEEHIMTCLKAGWKIKSPNQKVVDHVYKRLYEIFVATGISTNDMIRSIITNTIKYSNEYLVLVRSTKGEKRRTSGKPYKLRGQELQPIIGIFSPDPVTMTVRRKENGAPIQYRQTSNGSYSHISNIGGSGASRYFSSHLVLHCAYKRKNGRAYGTPYVVPVLEDIRALRRIEEMTEILVSSHIFPLYHYIVGTEAIPGSDEEVQRVKDVIEETPTEGSLVTSERHKIQVVGAEGKALDVTPFLNYFEKRVLAGLRISEISLGRSGSANRNTATSIDQTLIKRCEDVNYYVADFLTSTLIFELALDSGMVIKYQDMPIFEFDSIDEEAQRATENHNLNLYTSNGITEDELRQKNGWEAAPADDTRFVNRVSIHQAKEESKFAPKPASGAKPAAKTNKGAANRAQPTNQHGKKATQTKAVKNALDEMVVGEIAEVSRMFEHLKDTDFVARVSANMVAMTFDTIFSMTKDYCLTLSEQDGFDRLNIDSIIMPILKNRLKESTILAESFIKKNNTNGVVAALEDMAANLVGLGEEVESKIKHRDLK